MPNHKFARYLTSLLRHQAVNQGYKMDGRGFVSVDEIKKRCNNISFEEIEEIVKADNKGRFEMEERKGRWYIRAVQGHSIPNINPDLHLVKDPSEIPIVVHGTNKKAYESIITTGLNRMERNHIHFAHGTPEDETVISGMRKTSKVMIFIDVPKAMEAGIQFYKSSNGVILSDGIDGTINPSFFLRVEFVNASNDTSNDGPNISNVTNVTNIPNSNE